MFVFLTKLAYHAWLNSLLHDSMNNPRPITHEQFKDAVRRLLFKKPDSDVVSEDHEPTEEELEETFQVPSSSQTTERSEH